MEKIIPETHREKMMLLKVEIENLKEDTDFLTDLFLNWIQNECSSDSILIDKFGYKHSKI